MVRVRICLMASALVVGTAGALSAAASGAQAAREPDRAPPGYTKVFDDEFDGPTINPAKWAYDVHRNAIGWYNQEKQYYAAGRSENARIENGRLIIEARGETLD